MHVEYSAISCRITQCKELTEMAHIVPSAASEWYVLRGLSRHAEFKDAGNAILPRLSSEESVLVAHVFERNCSDEVVMLYHNVQLQPVHGVKLELLFVRFVLTVFDCYVEEFLKQGVKRWLRIKNENGEQERRLCSPQECRTYAVHARNISPSKRAQTGTSTTGAENQEFERNRSFSYSSGRSATLTELAEEEYEATQCRRRKRTPSYG